MLGKEQGLVLLMLHFLVMVLLFVLLLCYYFALPGTPSGSLLSTPTCALAGIAYWSQLEQIGVVFWLFRLSIIDLFGCC